jgi:ammonium transporter, Amt family
MAAGRSPASTMAEFVGDEQTLDLLREFGVDYAQAYHVARPRAAAEL